MNKIKLIEFLSKKETHEESMKQLSESRGISKEFLHNEGIFEIKTMDELWDLIDGLGINEHDIGITERNQLLLNHGYIIPIYDAYDRILMFVNYNKERPSESKYMNINLYKRAEVSEEEDATYDGSRDTILHKNVKMIGLETTKQGLIEDRMFVGEGVFDNKRMKSINIPATGLLGNKIMPYHIEYYSRFSNVYYIQDLDKSGDEGWEFFKKKIPHAKKILLKKLRYLDEKEEIRYIKDIDDFGKQGQQNQRYESEWKEFKKYLQNLGRDN